MVHPFDHLDVIAGQGTVALEILEQLPEVNTIVVPVGGGGLISGIAATAKALKPSIKIIGVEPHGAASVGLALESGELVPLEVMSTVADGRRALGLRHVQAFVDQLVTVNDEEIAEGLLLTAERAKMVVEPAGAAGVAALMSCEDLDITYPAVVVLSGGNIDPLLLLRVIRFGMGSAGRFVSFSTMLPDRPGELHRLSGVIATTGANVIGVEHRRPSACDVEITIQAETRGFDHVQSVIEQLKAAGYDPQKLSLA